MLTKDEKRKIKINAMPYVPKKPEKKSESSLSYAKKKMLIDATRSFANMRGGNGIRHDTSRTRDRAEDMLLDIIVELADHDEAALNLKRRFPRFPHYSDSDD